MTEAGEEKKSIPPYLPYKTFSNFIERLKVGVPSRIDRSLMGSFSGAAQAQLLSTLKYLGLISPNGIPTEGLKNLVNSEGPSRVKNLHDIVKTAYPFLFENDIDLTRITSKHLQELFENAGGITGGTVRKCIAFFVAISKEAGVELSPHIKVKATSVRSAPKRSGLERNSKAKSELPSTPPPQPYESQPLSSQVATQTWEQLLLAKFPEFDPVWPDEVKAKWFDGFKELMDSRKKG
ncbi:MAG: DUF5343 domain-containing protein [Deltaproteobacteria bacterium]|nr:DUF5343 domain-containing protein [Deltaproteobacteria bacterium]